MKNFCIISIISLFAIGCSSDSGGGVTPEPPVVVPPKPTYSDAELLTMVKADVLKYFWDFAESNSKLARERYHTDNPGNDAQTVTTGGSGFGLMTVLVGVKNGAISRAEAVSRLTTALNFLQKADRFHGAWPHWINGSTGKVIPFGADDNGGDLVETAFLAQGLITVREYFKSSTIQTEKDLALKADELWKGIELVYTKSECFILALVSNFRICKEYENSRL